MCIVFQWLLWILIKRGCWERWQSIIFRLFVNFASNMPLHDEIFLIVVSILTWTKEIRAGRSVGLAVMFIPLWFGFVIFARVSHVVATWSDFAISRVFGDWHFALRVNVASSYSIAAAHKFKMCHRRITRFWYQECTPLRLFAPGSSRQRRTTFSAKGKIFIN